MADQAGGGKDLLASWSFRGVALLVLSAVLQYFGHAPIADAELDVLIKVFEGLLPILGTVLGIFGIVRRPDIVSVAKVKLPGAGKAAALLLLCLSPLLTGCCGCDGGVRIVPRLIPRPCHGVCPAEANAECGMRNAELARAAIADHSALRIPNSAFGSIECPDPRLAVDLPQYVRQWYRNPDGSCVQCSGGMIGVDQNVPAAATLLWDTEYGPAERGGSGSSRVSRYAKSRGMRIFNVTGSQTIEWMKWACRNGRGAAIGAGSSHFQTLMGHDPASGTWWVCNNNSPAQIDEYDDAAFKRLHAASGPWIWILDYPPHAERPKYVAWWERPRQYR